VEYDSLLEKEHAEASEAITGSIKTDKLKYDKKKGGHEHDQHDHDTLKRHMEDIEKEQQQQQQHGKKQHSEEMKIKADENARNDGRTALHVAAGEGDINRLVELLKNENTEILHAKDMNGWQAIHEAVRSGRLEVVKYLVDMGADIGAKTSNGGTPLWWGKRILPADNEVVPYLIGISAPEEGPPDEEEEEEEESEN
jgi:hypothetical protein